MADGFGYALAADFGNEEAAVEQNGIRLLYCAFEKHVQMLRDGRIGHVGKTQLAKQAALLFLRCIAARGDRKKTTKCQLQRLLAQNFRFEQAADERRTRAQHRDLNALQVRIVEQPLFRRATLPAQSAALANRERHA